MKPLRAHLSEYILFFASRFSWIIPKWLFLMANDYSKNGFNEKKSDPIKSISLLEGSFNWRAISVVLEINQNDLCSIKKWLRKNSYASRVSSRKNSDSFKLRHNCGEGCHNLGWIMFNNATKLDTLTRINRPNSYSDSCYGVIEKMSGASCYLTLYFTLKKSATDMISRVDLSDITNYFYLQSLNPFSRRFKVVETHDKRSNAVKLIWDNIDLVCEDIKSITFDLLKMWKVKKESDALVFIGETYRNEASPYFFKEAKQTDTLHHPIIINRRSDIFDEKISTDRSESYCSHLSHENICLDAVYIRSRMIEQDNHIENDDLFSLDTPLSVGHSYLFLSLLIITKRKYDKITNYVNDILVSNNHKPETNYNILFNSTLMIDALEEALENINLSIDWHCKKRYAEYVKELIKYQSKLITQLKASVEKRKLRSNDNMQVENLKFHRRYSYIVGILIIIQIVIGALTIDWEKVKSFFFEKTSEVQKTRIYDVQETRVSKNLG